MISEVMPGGVFTEAQLMALALLARDERILREVKALELMRGLEAGLKKQGDNSVQVWDNSRHGIIRMRWDQRPIDPQRERRLSGATQMSRQLKVEVSSSGKPEAWLSGPSGWIQAEKHSEYGQYKESLDHPPSIEEQLSFARDQAEYAAEDTSW